VVGAELNLGSNKYSVLNYSLNPKTPDEESFENKRIGTTNPKASCFQCSVSIPDFPNRSIFSGKSQIVHSVSVIDTKKGRVLY
jgi:hypothetical protein